MKCDTENSKEREITTEHGLRGARDDGNNCAERVIIHGKE